MVRGRGVALGLALGAVGCGGTVSERASPGDESDAGGRSAGSGGRVGQAGGSGGAGGIAATGTGGVCRSDNPGGLEPLPIDLFILLHQSSAMRDLVPGTEETWWHAADRGVSAFVDDPRTGGMGVGIQYFPPSGVAPASCMAPYSSPDVTVRLLPGVAGDIKSSLSEHSPTAGGAPTGPALQGAIDYLRGYAPPGRAPAVVLVTDGFPSECEPGDTNGVAELARQGYEAAPRIRTFVVGLGQGLSDLGQIARAGGTEGAFLIEGGDVGDQLTNALLTLSKGAPPCELEVPPPPSDEARDLDMIFVDYTPHATAIAEPLPKLQDRDDCDLAGNGGEGWYFDVPESPARILVCPGTCERLAAGTVNAGYGCPPTLGQTD